MVGSWNETDLGACCDIVNLEVAVEPAVELVRSATEVTEPASTEEVVATLAVETGRAVLAILVVVGAVVLRTGACETASGAADSDWRAPLAWLDEDTGGLLALLGGPGEGGRGGE